MVGLGYVGLPLLLAFHEAGCRVFGFDVDNSKLDLLEQGGSYLMHIDASRAKALAASGRFRAARGWESARECDALLLCVPTPLDAHREPDLRFIRGTAESLAPHLRPGQLVCLESTTYPGTTREVLGPLLEAGSGLAAGRDFLLAYSPEREDPGNKSFSTARIPKVVGGATPEALAAAASLYRAVVSEVVPVSSCEAAEASKLLENIFRCVNIALVNELKVLFDRMGIDVWEVVEAASTKPFGFMPFYPGPGLGGHCIPIDPFYLSWKAKEFETPTKFIELAGEVNRWMPEYVVGRVGDALNEQRKAINGSRILVAGLAYKPDIDDIRESPSLRLIELLEAKGAEVDFHDPHVAEIPPTREHLRLAGRRSAPIREAGRYDAVLIATAHRAVDYRQLGQDAALIVDTRNAMADVDSPRAVVRKA